jgi:hypothetical protein
MVSNDCPYQAELAALKALRSIWFTKLTPWLEQRGGLALRQPFVAALLAP